MNRGNQKTHTRATQTKGIKKNTQNKRMKRSDGSHSEGNRNQSYSETVDISDSDTE